MVVRIIRTSLDESGLHRRIDFIHSVGISEPRYIVMNQSTVDFLKSHNGIASDLALTHYHGIPVAICNKLKHGEVDVV